MLTEIKDTDTPEIKLLKKALSLCNERPRQRYSHGSSYDLASEISALLRSK